MPRISETRESLSSTFATRVQQAQFAGLMRALDGGRSVAFSFFGDSTGDSDGSSSAADRTSARFARRLAEEYPTHHVLFKHWDAGNSRFGPWTVMQSHADGRRYATVTTRSMRYNPPDAGISFTSGNLDLRVLVSPTSWAPGSGGDRILLARAKGEGTWGTEFQYRWVLKQDATLSLQWSTNGTAYNTAKTSTVVVPGVNGTPLWLRVTAEINPATGWDVKFYTSAATDGATTWTQLGTTVSYSGATTAMFDAADAWFEVGAEYWQPASTPCAGKFYEVQIRDGVNGATLTPCALEEWERYGDSATTFGGAPTLYVLNASQSSTTISTHAARVNAETPNYGQVLAIFNDGHNESTNSGSLWIDPYEAWVAAVKVRLPNAAIVVIGQSPHTSAWVNEAAYGPEHPKRIFELSAAAARLGWGFVNIYAAFLDSDPDLDTLVSGDGLHPTATGYTLCGDTVASAAGVF